MFGFAIDCFGFEWCRFGLVLGVSCRLLVLSCVLWWLDVVFGLVGGWWLECLVGSGV